MNIFRFRTLWGPVVLMLAILSNYADGYTHLSYFLVAGPLALIWACTLPASLHLWSTGARKYPDVRDRAAIRRFLSRQQTVFETAGLTRQNTKGETSETIYPRIVKHSPVSNYGVEVIIDRRDVASHLDFEKAAVDIGSSLRLKFHVTVEVHEGASNYTTKLTIATRSSDGDPRQYTSHLDDGDSNG